MRPFAADANPGRCTPEKRDPDETPQQQAVVPLHSDRTSIRVSVSGVVDGSPGPSIRFVFVGAKAREHFDSDDREFLSRFVRMVRVTQRISVESERGAQPDDRPVHDSIRFLDLHIAEPAATQRVDDFPIAAQRVHTLGKPIDDGLVLARMECQ